MSDPVILQYLENIQETVKRIDAKQDQHAEDITGLKEFRADIKGSIRTASAFTVFGAGVVTWLINHLKPWG